MYYFYIPDNKFEQPITVERLLRSIGASGRLNGFDYAVFMVEQIVNGQSSIHLITKCLYPETAKHFGVLPHSVERSLRTLISSCWKYGEKGALSEIAGRPLHKAPTNADFIDMLAAYIKNRN